MTDIVIDFSKPLAAEAFHSGQFVLYRNPNLYWAGKPDHTFPCRVKDAWGGRVYLVDLRSGREIGSVRPEYVRLLPAVDCMRDIDAAPLSSETPGLHPAAVAWLEQNTASAAVDGGAA